MHGYVSKEDVFINTMKYLKGPEFEATGPQISP
jgi:hypothetical protein